MLPAAAPEWSLFASDPEAQLSLATLWRMTSACEGVAPELACKLALTVDGGGWPRVLDPLARIPGFVACWESLRSAAGEGTTEAIDFALAILGARPMEEVPPWLLDAHVTDVAACVESYDDVALGLACEEVAGVVGARRYLEALAPALAEARSIPRGVVEWLVRHDPDPGRRLRWKLRMSSGDDDTDVPAPLDAAERAALRAVDPVELGDREIEKLLQIAGASLEAADLDRLLRPSLLELTEDIDEPSIHVVRALRRASPSRRSALVPSGSLVEGCLRSGPSLEVPPLPAALTAALTEAWQRLHADDLGHVPRAYVSRVLEALDGPPWLPPRPWAVAGANTSAVDNRRARVERLLELSAPEVIVGREIEITRRIERATGLERAPEVAELGASVRGLELAKKVGARLLPMWTEAHPDDPIASELLSDLDRIARGEPRAYVHHHARLERDSGADPSFAVPTFLYVELEHRDGAPHLTIQDTPLDVAVGAFGPFKSVEAAPARRAFWTWWLTDAVPSVASELQGPPPAPGSASLVQQ